ILRFQDSSVYEDTTISARRGTFRIATNHLIQKGPSFKQPIDISIAVSTDQVNIRYTEAKGKEKVIAQRMNLPPDVANGLLFTLIKDVNPKVPRTTVSWVATTPKPRRVKLAILPHGEEPFTIGRFRHKAMRFVVKAEIPGITGFLAR